MRVPSRPVSWRLPRAERHATLPLPPIGAAIEGGAAHADADADAAESERSLDDASHESEIGSSLDDLDYHAPVQSTLRRCAIPGTVVIVLCGAVGFAASQPARTLSAAVSMLNGLRSLGPSAPVAVIGIQIVLVVCALPSWFVWVGTGTLFTLVWGPSIGLLVALASVGVGVWVGSCLAFALGRSCFRPLISEWTAERPIFRAIDLAVSQRGLQVGMLIKLSPVFPLNVMNYVLAITQISVLNFVVTCSGSMLSVTVYVLIGASLSSLAAIDSVGASGSSSRRTVTIVTIVGCAIGGASLLYVMHASRRAYAELMLRAHAANEVLLDVEDAEALALVEEGAVADGAHDERSECGEAPASAPASAAPAAPAAPAARTSSEHSSTAFQNRMSLDPKHHGTERDPIVVLSARRSGASPRVASARGAPTPRPSPRAHVATRRTAGSSGRASEPGALEPVVPAQAVAPRAAAGAGAGAHTHAQLARTMTDSLSVRARTPIRAVRRAALSRSLTAGQLLDTREIKRGAAPSRAQPAPAQPRLVDRVFRQFLEPALVPQAAMAAIGRARSPMRLNNGLLQRVNRERSLALRSPTPAAPSVSRQTSANAGASARSVQRSCSPLRAATLPAARSRSPDRRARTRAPAGKLNADPLSV